MDNSAMFAGLRGFISPQGEGRGERRLNGNRKKYNKNWKKAIYQIYVFK